MKLWYNHKKRKSGDLMSHDKFMNGTCPACGEALTVPAHLKEFSCLYCGKRLSGEDLQRPAEKTDTDAAAAKAYYEAHILQTITAHLGIDKQVTNSAYAKAFAHYTASNEETFRQLQAAVSGDHLTPEDAVTLYLDQLERHWKEDTTRKQSVKFKMQTDKFVIAVFLVPMIRSLKLPISEEYCEVLQKQWCERHPKSPFYLGTYEEMQSGFQKKILGLCFITTAVCRQEGKSDDCEELTAFRSFRDGYLRSCPDGPALISKYYDIAPGILLHIELSDEKERIYQTLRHEYLQPCYEDIKSGRLHCCKQRYTQMVTALERKYLS